MKRASGTVTVLIDFDLSGELIQEIAAVSQRLTVQQKICNSPDEVEAALDEHVEILYARSLPNRMAAAPSLKWVQLHYAGVNHLFAHPLFEGDVHLTTSSGAHAVPAAEYTIGAMIALARGFPAILRDQEQREWNRDHDRKRELHGNVLLVLGYGSIGREVARQAQGFNMRIVAVKRHSDRRRDPGFILPGTGDPEGTIPERIAGQDELLDVLPQADYVVSTLPLTPETEGFVGERELRAMRPSAFLVNMSRGGVFHEPSLIRALRDGWVAGAALDVFAEEPLPGDSPFYEVPNVLISPHISASRENPRYDGRANAIFVENLRRYLDGRPLLNLVHKERGY